MEEAAERYCNLSDQQQSLHARENPRPLPLLARDFLSSLTNPLSLFVPSSQEAPKTIAPYANNDLYLRLRTLLI